MDTDIALVLPMVQMQKDPTGVEGMIHNEDSDKVEVYDGTDWTQVVTQVHSIQAFTGDGSTNFTLTVPLIVQL